MRFELNDLQFDTEAQGLKSQITNPLSADYTTTPDQESEKRDKNNSYNYKPEKFLMTELGDKGKIKYEYPDIDL